MRALGLKGQPIVSLTSAGNSGLFARSGGSLEFAPRARADGAGAGEIYPVAAGGYILGDVSAFAHNSGDAAPPPRPARPSAIDESAFAALHERYEAGLRTFLLKRTGNRALSEELAQDAWGEAWRAVRNGQYDPSRAAFSTFLYAIGYKRYLQYRRTLMRRGPTVGGDPFEDAVARLMDVDGTPNESAEFAELLDDLRGCLSNPAGPNVLSERERAIVDGLSSGRTERELAGELRIAPSTAHDAKKSAYQKLRRCLTAKGHFDPPASSGAPSANNPTKP